MFCCGSNTSLNQQSAAAAAAPGPGGVLVGPGGPGAGQYDTYSIYSYGKGGAMNPVSILTFFKAYMYFP